MTFIFSLLPYFKMHRVAIVSLFMLLHVTTGFSQVTKLDSLINVLNSHKIINESRIDLLNNIGYRYWIVDAKNSIEYGKQALELSKKLNYSKGTAKANRVIGVAYWSQGYQNKALAYLNDSFNAYTTLDDQEGIANTTLNIGMVYADLKDYEKAIRYYEKAIDTFTSLGLKSRIATTYTKLASVLLEQRKNKDALQFLLNALEIHTENDFTYGIAEVHNRLALLYLNTDEKEQAFFHVKKAIALGKQVNDAHGLTNNTIIYGRVLRGLENQLEATQVMKQGLELALINNLKQYELEAYDQLKDLKREQDNLEESLMYYDKYITLKDSLVNSEKSKQIAYLEFKNELELKDKKLLALNAQEKSDRTVKYSLIFIIGVVSISAMVIFLVSRSRAKKSKELSVKVQDHLASQNKLTQKELENSELKRGYLNKKLDYKNKELTSYTLNFIRKNEIVSQLDSTIKEIKKSSSIDKNKLITDLKKIIRKNLSIDKDWENFNLFFDDIHKGFDTTLKNKHPELTGNDLKLCSLIRLNLNIKEMAGILNISPESVKTARYRLRKKLNLESGQEIYSYLSDLE